MRITIGAKHERIVRCTHDSGVRTALIASSRDVDDGS